MTVLVRNTSACSLHRFRLRQMWADCPEGRRWAGLVLCMGSRQFVWYRREVVSRVR